MPRMLRRLFVVALVLSACFASAAPAADASSALEDLEPQIEAWMAEWKVPGLGISVVYQGEVVLARGFGYRDLEGEVPVTADTLFAIGSNTKSFTVTLLGMLVDEGLLDWDEPIQRRLLPDFRLHDPVATELMTARDLVTHRSGLPRHDLLWLATGLSREELYARLRYLEPSKSFREAYQYQNLMFMTAGLLAERLTGESWESLVIERIFEPLGMERTTLSVDTIQHDDDFSFAYAHEEGGEPERIPFRNIDAVGPAGSINSSAREMARYVQFHLDYGKASGEQLLSEENARAMQSPQMPVTGPQLAAFFSGVDEGLLGDPSYGLGLMVSSYRGHKHVRHGGGIDGFISSMEWLPHDRIGVVVLSNTSGSATVPGLVVRAIFDRLLGLEPIDWAERARKAEVEERKETEEAKARRTTERHEGTRPSHDLVAYAGSYRHPGYGDLEVRLAGEELAVTAVGFDLPLQHFHYDVFVVPEGLDRSRASFSGGRLSFHSDKSGRIDRVEVPLEPNVADIVFERVDEEAASSSAPP